MNEEMLIVGSKNLHHQQFACGEWVSRHTSIRERTGASPSRREDVAHDDGHDFVPETEACPTANKSIHAARQASSKLRVKT